MKLEPAGGAVGRPETVTIWPSLMKFAVDGSDPIDSSSQGVYHVYRYDRDWTDPPRSIFPVVFTDVPTCAPGEK